MALSVLNLFVEPGTAAVLTVWRDVVNADTVVDITVDPAMAGLTATAFTDGAGPDFGRVDITVPSSATAGAYTWSIEIASVPVWEGQIFIADNARNTSYTSHSIDLRSETEPPVYVARSEDLVDPSGAGAATQLIETGGPTTLDLGAIADGEYLQRVGTEIVGATPAGLGDVTAAAAFAADNRLIRSDGTGKGVQASTAILSDAGALSGLTTITASGVITGSNLSGTNTGDQTISLTGDVTGTGTGSFAATIAADAVTYAKLQNVSAASRLLGRGDSGSGDPQEITIGSGLVMTGTTLSAVGDGTGDVHGPASATDNAFARFDTTTGKLLQNGVVTCSDTGVVAGVDDLTLTGSITMNALETVDGRDVSVDGAALDTLGANAVTAAAAFATDERLLRSDGTGKGAQASAIAVTDAGAVTGITSLSASGVITGSNLSGTNTGDQTITLTGDVTGTGTGSFAATIANGAVTYAKMQDVSAASRILGRGSAGGAGDPEELTLGSGLALTGTVLSATGGGLGDVVGPASATDNAFARFDLTTGKLLQDGPVTCSDTGVVTGVDDLTLTGSIIMSALETVDGRDISADWTTSSAHFANTSNPHSVTAAQVGAIAMSQKGAASGVASLDASTRLVEAAQVLRVTGQDLTAGACTDGQFLTRSGTTYAGVTHGNTGDPHTQYQLESEKGSASGYAGLDASGYVAQAAPIIRATGVSLTVGSVADGEALVRSGSTIVGLAASTAYRYGMGIPSSGLGSNGDSYERIATGEIYTKSGGAWAKASLSSPSNSGAVLDFAAFPRYNSATMNSTVNMTTPTVVGTQNGEAYSTASARQSAHRTSWTPTATANTVSSGIQGPGLFVINTNSAAGHGRWQLKIRFGLSAVTATNFRFFVGLCSGLTLSVNPSTAAGASALGDRVGLIVDANTALAGRWFVNAGNTTQNNTAASTLVADNWYEFIFWNEPFSAVVNMELWEQTTANGAFSLASSIAYTTTAITDGVMRPTAIVANAATAAGSGTLHFGGLNGRILTRP